MKVFSSALNLPLACNRICGKYFLMVLRAKKVITTSRIFGGRGTAISGSRPTISVSLWWRVWVQRQTVDSRITIKEAISYKTLLSQSVLKAVPWPDSCQRESEVEA